MQLNVYVVDKEGPRPSRIRTVCGGVLLKRERESAPGEK